MQRLAGSNQTMNKRGRDIIGTITFFRDNELLMQKAWEKGPLHLDKLTITLWPDMFKRTLLMRNKLKPLLELIKSKGGKYRWGYSFQLFINNG